MRIQGSNSKWNRSMAYLCIGILLLTSCFHESMEECVIEVKFDYSYNIKQENTFGSEVSKAKLWIFDRQGVLLAQYQNEGKDLRDNQRILVSGMEQGEYKMVAWAYEPTLTDTPGGFIFPELIIGKSTVDELTIQVRKASVNNECEGQLDVLLCGEYELDFANDSREICMINMLKCTNNIRVELRPAKDGQQLFLEDYDFLITDKNSCLNYCGEQLGEEMISYRPYYTGMEKNISSDDDTEVSDWVVADWTVSRLFSENEPSLQIMDRESNTILLDVNLTKLLCIQEIGEHKEQWSDQEYLDRQDNYTVTFFIEESGFVMNRIIVNDWVVSIEDTELK